MPVERTLYKNGKEICTLYPAHNFYNLIDDTAVELFKHHLCASMKWSNDYELRYDEVESFLEEFDTFISDIERRGGSKIFDYIMEDEGMEYRDE